MQCMKIALLNTKRQAIHLKTDQINMHELERKKERKNRPQPQGAISRSNTKRPVLYTAWLDIRTLGWFIELSFELSGMITCYG